MIERKHLFIETELLDWNDIFILNNKLQSQLIFRGQGDKNWQITSSLERLMNRLHPNHIDKIISSLQEREMIREFQWKYPLFKEKSIDDENYVEWLSILQHYGAATRLVDFTTSFFVATYMAIYESSTDSAVWAINKDIVNHKTFTKYIERHQVNGVSMHELDQFSLELANNFIKYSFKSDIEKGLLFINPKEINERLYRQQGLFIMPTNTQISFMENVKPYLSNEKPVALSFYDLLKLSDSDRQDQVTIIKINIPFKLHLSIIKNLRLMNINSEILFPGIEGLAKSLNYSKFNL